MNRSRTRLAAAAVLLAAAAAAAPTAAARASDRVDHAVRALDTAREQMRHGRAYDIESERHRGRRVWEVKVAAGQRRPYEYLVSADGKRIVRSRRAHERSDDAAKARRAKVGLAAALRKADRRVGGRFSEAEIDRERGRIVWTATFELRGDREREVVVDARSGKVLRIETDD